MSDSLDFGSRTQNSPSREEAFEQLSSQLAELRGLPGFPRGDDEAILRMSLPPEFTACPNPFLADWLKSSAPPGYDEKPYSDPGPFTADISEGKSHRIYKAHAFHTKVPHQAIMRYILHYTRPGDVVLDGFCGSGMAGVAAQACGAPDKDFRQRVDMEMPGVQWGTRRAILQDLSPAATFIAAGLNLPMPADAFESRSQEMLDAFDADWGWMYETHHTDGQTAKIDFTVWSEVFTCPHCGDAVVFYEAAFDEDTKKVRDDFRCSHCGAEAKKTSLERRLIAQRTLGGDVINRVEFRPVQIHYRVGKQRYNKAPDDDDLNVLRRINSAHTPWFPSDDMHVKKLWHGYNFGPRGFSRVHHLWSDRSLATLAVLWDMSGRESDPSVRVALRFWIEQAFWGLSWMNRYRPEGYSQVSQYQSGVYYFPALVSECSVHYNMVGSQPDRGKRKNLVTVWRGHKPSGEVRISTASSSRLLIGDSTVDYIFLDPPFGLNIPYTDLNLLVEYWHGVVADPAEEAVVHRVRGRDVAEYQSLLEQCFEEFYRVLKPGRWMTVEFSNSSNSVWMALQEAMSRAGFVVADTRVLDKEQHSWIQVRRPNAVKHDIILSAYKPADELEERFSLVAGTEDGAWEFIREHLAHLPISEGDRKSLRVARERQGDRLYDRMVAFHIHKTVTVPLTAAEFYIGLEHRFPVRDEMYFLPDQVEIYEQRRMKSKEMLQAELFITNEASAVQWLRQQLKEGRKSFSKIQPRFFSELQNALPEWEELPDLKQLLEENFLQDENDRWYVPDPRNASDLARVRTRALLREFSGYAETKGKLERFRSEAIRAGFREAWGQRDFHLILQVGKKLPSDAFEEDETLLYYFDNAQRLAR